MRPKFSTSLIIFGLSRLFNRISLLLRKNYTLKFNELPIHPQVLEAITAMGFETPSPIQAEAIPLAIEGNDILGCAQTGTGKTAAFLVPTLHGILTKKLEGKLSALIITPTRELALQIDQQIDGLSYFTGVVSAAVYGGGSGFDFDMEKKALTSGAEIIVATPGRLISHVNLGYVDFSNIDYLILDEADRMLDMGFIEDITKISNLLPKKRQTFLFSATMPPKIKNLAAKLQRDPKEIKISVSKTASKIVQKAILVYDQHKLKVILDIVTKSNYRSIIIFCSTKSDTKHISAEMQKRGLSAKSFHSDLEQEEREARMLAFKNRSIQVLIGTDIISRGIDVEDIDLVINHTVPPDAEDYVHRVGRTARAAAEGKAITLINEYDQRKFQKIEQLIELEIEKSKPAEGLGDGPDYDPVKNFKSKPKFGGKKPGFKGKRNFNK